MTQSGAGAESKRIAISLTGIKPGTSAEDLVAALRRIFPRKTAEQIRGALARLPLLLTRSASEEQAKRVKGFLESKGAILRLASATVSAEQAPLPSKAKAPSTAAAAPQESEMVRGAAASQRDKPYTGVERRAKPRVHPGIGLHPMGIGEILDRSFRLLRQHFLLFFFILLIPQGIFFAFKKTSHMLFGVDVQQGMTASMGMGLLVSIILVVFIMLIIQFWAQGALVYAVSENYLGHKTSVGASYGAMRSRLGRLVGTMIIMGILLGLLGVVIIFLSGMIVGGLGTAGGLSGLAGFIVVCTAGAAIFFHFFLNWLLVDKVVVLEDQAWFGALSRSTQLMKSRTEQGFWKRPKNKAGLILFLGFLIGVGIHLLFQVPGLLARMFLPMNLAGLTLTLQQVLNVIATSLATAFAAIAMILFYYDIRLRSEGFDLKAMAEHL
jgi:hypothetical protein